MIKRFLRRALSPFLWEYTAAELALGKVSFSQFGEDLLIKDLFSTHSHGFYVDVGAFHPIYLSNTYALYRIGWKGLAIDAYPRLATHFGRFRPRDEFLYSAVGSNTGTVRMRMFGEGSFNCFEDLAESVPEAFRGGAQTMEVPINPLAKILAARNTPPVDFLNVDCEGADLQILQSNDWSRWSPKVICVEDHSEIWVESEISTFLRELNYVAKFRTGLSSVFVRAR